MVTPRKVTETPLIKYQISEHVAESTFLSFHQEKGPVPVAFSRKYFAHNLIFWKQNLLHRKLMYINCKKTIFRIDCYRFL